MEQLVIDLRHKLFQRKMNEMKKIENLDKEADVNLILVASGKIFELDFLINKLDNLIEYFHKNQGICF